MIQVSTPQNSVSKVAPKLPMPQPISLLDNVTRKKRLGVKALHKLLTGQQAERLKALIGFGWDLVWL